MEEKLEIMQWLYEHGVEPRMWYSPLIEQWNKLYNPDNNIENLVPWYPLEQVLEELLKQRGEHGLTIVRTLVEDDIYLAALKLLKQVKEQGNG